MPTYPTALEHPVFRTVAQAASNLGLECYVIGGFVRDFLLKRGDAKDIDIVAVGSGIALANEVSKLLITTTVSDNLLRQILRQINKLIDVLIAKEEI